MNPTRYKTEESEEHADIEKLKYKHFLLDIIDAILPSLIGGEPVSFQHIKENFTTGNVVTIFIGKPQLPLEPKQTYAQKRHPFNSGNYKTSATQSALLSQASAPLSLQHPHRLGKKRQKVAPSKNQKNFKWNAHARYPWGENLLSLL